MATVREAVKIVDGKEVDWIDPVVSVDVRETEVVINNGAHDYVQSISEWPLWKIRFVEQGED